MAELVAEFQTPLRAVCISASGAVCALTAFMLIAEPGAGRSALAALYRHCSRLLCVVPVTDSAAIAARPSAAPSVLAVLDALGLHEPTTVTVRLDRLVRDVPELPGAAALMRNAAAVDPDHQVALAARPRAGAQTRFGSYLLGETVGGGGMGCVVRAEDLRTGRLVALKRLHPRLLKDPIACERFRRERALLAALDSAHIIPVHEIGEIDGEPFVAMHLADQSLTQLLAEHPDGLEPQQAAQIVSQVADALSHVHTAGFAHRDIKLSNVVLDTTTPGPHCYLIDVGIAAPLATAGSASGGEDRLTAAWAVLGTPTYMAPELFIDSAASIRTDVYALGVLAYRLLTGYAPFAGDGPAQIAAQHQLAAPLAASTGRPDLAPADPVLARALAKDPASRYPDPPALATALTAAVTPGLAAAAPPSSGTSLEISPEISATEPGAVLPVAPAPDTPSPAVAAVSTLALPLPSNLSGPADGSDELHRQQQLPGHLPREGTAA